MTAILSRQDKLPRTLDELLRGESPDVIRGDDKLVAYGRARVNMKKIESAKKPSGAKKKKKDSGRPSR